MREKLRGDRYSWTQRVIILVYIIKEEGFEICTCFRRCRPFFREKFGRKGLREQLQVAMVNLHVQNLKI